VDDADDAVAGGPPRFPGPPLRGDLAAALEIELDDDESCFSAELVAVLVQQV
jgi:hypothetical protein